MKRAFITDLKIFLKSFALPILIAGGTMYLIKISRGEAGEDSMTIFLYGLPILVFVYSLKLFIKEISKLRSKEKQEKSQ